MRSAEQGRSAGEPRKLGRSQLLAVVLTFAALALFINIGARLFSGEAVAKEIYVAFILNIALILFGWTRAKDLRSALDAQAAAEVRANDIAYHDHTTGLANRRELMRALEEAVRQGGQNRALFLIDLDHFKKVNDLNGHAAGDELLRRVASHLQRVTPYGACCARLGGDEFAVLLPEVLATREVEKILDAILKGAEQQVRLSDFSTAISASIGVSVLSPGTTAEDALRRSDIAMYAAKKAGRNRAFWFSQEMENELQTRLALEHDLKEGIDNNEFVPFYQPQIDLPTGNITGFEVLARWRSPTRGLVEPAGFIEVAEATGLIAPLSLSVMRQALLEARNWPNHLLLAVNLSPVQFRDPSLAERILQIVTETGFPPHRLELEITESAIFEDQDQALTIVHSLKNTGMCVSLDDFGTGYASLTQLQALPFDRIKIDKSFVASFFTNSQSNAIVSTIAALAKSLKLPVTAEGVETNAVRGELLALGCSNAQGWLFGRAMPAEEVRTFLELPSGHTESEILPAIDIEQVDRRDQRRRSSKGRTAG